MKAVVRDRYGSPDVLRLEEVEKPTPGDSDVLIRIDATLVQTAGIADLTGDPFIARLEAGLFRPKHRIPGTEFAGQVEAVGKDVKRFREGEEVFGFTGLGRGSQAEYICLSEDEAFVGKPTNLNAEEAVAVFGETLTAIHFLKTIAKVRNGQSVLVNGASGAVGTAAVQIAKHFGADVTGVCSTANLEMVRSLGADRVIDYTQEDFTRSSAAYDVIFDTVGKSSYSRSKKALGPGGLYLTTVPTFAILPQMLWTNMFGSRRAIIAFAGLVKASQQTKNLLFLKELAEAGEFRPVIDRRYTLEQIAEAYTYVAEGHKKGNVVIAVGPGDA